MLPTTWARDKPGKTRTATAMSHGLKNRCMGPLLSRLRNLAPLFGAKCLPLFGGVEKDPTNRQPRTNCACRLNPCDIERRKSLVSAVEMDRGSDPARSDPASPRGVPAGRGRSAKREGEGAPPTEI